MILSSQSRLLLLIGGCAVLWSLEQLAPLFRYRRYRLRRSLPNVTLTALVVLTNLLLSFVAASASATVVSRGIGLFSLARVPLGLDVVLSIAALDLCAYVAHVALHRSSLGWRFHRVHHSDEEVDVTTAFRQHPVESFWRILWQLPAIVVLGIPMWMVILYLTLSTLNAQLEHANIRVNQRLDSVLRFFVVTPDMHKTHHSCHQPETDSNYANLFSVWDRMFGTYTHGVRFETLRYGLDALDQKAPHGLATLLAMPFIRQ